LHRVDQEILPHPRLTVAMRHLKNRGIILSGLWLPQLLDAGG
jgi:hypothetical protein